MEIALCPTGNLTASRKAYYPREGLFVIYRTEKQSVTRPHSMAGGNTERRK
jgi:hypothetical protein